MADFNKLKDTIRGAIYPNGRGAISADKHQAALLDMADTMQETAAQVTELESNQRGLSSSVSANAESFIRQVAGGHVTFKTEKWLSDIQRGYIEFKFRRPKDIATSSFPFVWLTKSSWSGFIITSGYLRYYNNGQPISAFLFSLSEYVEDSLLSVKIVKDGNIHDISINGIQLARGIYDDVAILSDFYIGAYPAEPVTSECITDYYSVQLYDADQSSYININASSKFSNFTAKKFLMGVEFEDSSVNKELAIRSITYGKGDCITTGILKTDGSIAPLDNYITSDFIDLTQVDTGVGMWQFKGLFTQNSGNYAGLVVYDKNYNVTASYTGEGYHVMRDEDRYIRFTPFEDNAEVTACFKANLTSVNLRGRYTLTDVVVLSKNTILSGNDCVISVSGKGKIVLTDGCSIEDMTLKGSWNPTRKAGEGEYRYSWIPVISESDVANVDAYMGEEVVLLIGQNATIQNVIFKDIERLCVKYTDQSQAYKVKTQCNIIGNHFDNVKAAIHYIGEFGRIIGNIFHSCIYGAILDAGNLAMSACNFIRCDIGMVIRSSHGNAGHSEFSSVEAAHCGIAGLYIESLPRNLGNVFTGCHFADAAIIGIDCSSLIVNASRIETYVDIRQGGYCGFTSCIVGKGYYNRDNKGYIFNLPTGSILRNNIPMDNATLDSEINNS